MPNPLQVPPTNVYTIKALIQTPKPCTPCAAAKHLSETNLHSKSKNGALASILASVDTAKQQGTPIILIIHGKGRHSGGASVVKAITRDTLKYHPEVLGYCSALPKDGSTGAVYVLIDT